MSRRDLSFEAYGREHIETTDLPGHVFERKPEFKAGRSSRVKRRLDVSHVDSASQEADGDLRTIWLEMARCIVKNLSKSRCVPSNPVLAFLRFSSLNCIF